MEGFECHSNDFEFLLHKIFSENWGLCDTPDPQIMLMAKNRILNKHKFSLARPLKLKHILNMRKTKRTPLKEYKTASELMS